MRRLPLRIRLTLAFAVAMAVVLAILGAFLYVRVREALDEQLNQSLRTRAQAAGIAGPGRRVGDDEGFVQVLGGNTSGPLSPEEVERARRESYFAERERVPGLEGPIRLFVTEANGRVVVAGTSLDDRDEAVSALLTQLAIGGPIALVLASLAGYALAGAALRPVEAMRQRAQEISARVDGDRLPEPEGDDEIARLARTLNAMLARLEAGMERERRFVAEASHELRTPLASLKAELELALRRPRSTGELRAAIASAVEETDRLAALAEDLLVLARSDEGELRVDRRPIRARELLENVARRFAARAEEAGLDVEVDAPGGARGQRRSGPARAGGREPRRQCAPLRVGNGPPRGRRRQRIAFPGRVRRGTGIRAGVPPARIRALHPRRRVAGGRLRRPRARDRGCNRPGAWWHGVRRKHVPWRRPGGGHAARLARHQRLDELLLQPGEVRVDGELGGGGIVRVQVEAHLLVHVEARAEDEAEVVQNPEP